ncbi:nwd2 [Moniliophthora roreri]|nr:nwd2 [Moniliophthora roreri]
MKVKKVTRSLNRSADEWSAEDAEYHSMMRAPSFPVREQLHEDADMASRHSNDNDHPDPASMLIPPGEEGILSSYASGESEYHALSTSTLEHSNRGGDNRKDWVKFQNKCWEKQGPHMFGAYLALKAPEAPTTDAGVDAMFSPDVRHNVKSEHNGPHIETLHGDVSFHQPAICINNVNGSNNNINNDAKNIILVNDTSKPTTTRTLEDASSRRPGFAIEARTQNTDPETMDMLRRLSLKGACRRRVPLDRHVAVSVIGGYDAGDISIADPSIGLPSLPENDYPMQSPYTSPDSDDHTQYASPSSSSGGRSSGEWPFSGTSHPALPDSAWRTQYDSPSEPEQGITRLRPPQLMHPQSAHNIYNAQNAMIPGALGPLMSATFDQVVMHPTGSHHHQSHGLQPSPASHFNDAIQRWPSAPSYPPPTSHNLSTNHTVNGMIVGQLRGNVNNYYGIDPLQSLKDAANLGATHNAAARIPFPHIHKGTRIEVLDRIRQWFRQEESNVFWLHGGVGVGKSAIAQAICDEFSEKERLAASFFFTRTQTDNDHNSIGSLVATFALQLAKTNSQRDSFIKGVLSRNGSVLLNTSIEERVRRLVIDPILEFPFEGDETILFAVDGLDEYYEKRDQRSQSLRMLLKSIAELTEKCPRVKFLICSRSTEEGIRTWVQSRASSLAPCCFELGGNLDETISMNIRTYLQDKFTELLGDERPTDAETDELVRRAGNQFIFAQAVLDHINQEGTGFSAKTLLQGIMDRIRGENCDDTGGNPFSSLDALYREILSKIKWAWKPLLRLLLTPHLRAGYTDRGPNGETLTLASRETIITHRTCWLLGNRLALPNPVLDMRTRLRDLRAVIRAPPIDQDHGSVSFRHTSFLEFITDASRSKEYHVEPLIDREIHDGMAQVLLRRARTFCSKYQSTADLESQLAADKSSRMGGGKDQNVWEVDGHALSYWLYHCKESQAPSTELIRELDKLDPYSYLVTALRMGNWEHPWYNPNRYADRTELVWEWIHHLYKALEWAKTLQNRPLKFIQHCTDLLHSGCSVSLPLHVQQNRDYQISATAEMLRFFLATADLAERDAAYEYWVERLPEQWRCAVEEVVEQAGREISIRPLDMEDMEGTAIQMSGELRNAIKTELARFSSSRPEELKGQQRMCARMLRTTEITDREVGLLKKLAKRLLSQISSAQRKKEVGRKLAAYNSCSQVAQIVVNWIATSANRTSVVESDLAAELRQVKTLAEKKICNTESRMRKRRAGQERSKSEPPAKRRRKTKTT